MFGKRSHIFTIVSFALVAFAYGQMKMNIGQSGQKFTILPQRSGLNLADSIFVDINNDGRDDLLVGGDASYGGDDIASFFLLLADRIRPENSPFDLATQQADRRYNAASTGDFHDCICLATGDWNADGREDVAIVGKYAEANRGAVYIILGTESFTTGTVETLGATTVDVFLRGNTTGSNLGGQMTTADVNGDGNDDLLLLDSSNLYILFGGAGFTAHHNTVINSASADVTYSSWGYTVGVGDVNQDGRDDLFYGAGDTNRIYFAKSSYTSHEVIDTSVQTAEITTLNYGGWTGPPSFACTDFNGDGMKDFVIIDDGHYKTLWGRTQWSTPRTIDLVTTFGVHVIYGGYYGGDQTDVADIDGDGVGDVAVGDDYTGKIHVVFGRDFGNNTTYNVATGPEKDDILFYNGGYHFATWVRIGDVDADGTWEFASGAWAEGPQYSGIVHVCFLNPDLGDLAFVPSSPTSVQDLSVTFSTGWEEGQEVTYRWLVNGEVVSGETESTLDHSYYIRGDLITAEVTASLESFGSTSDTLSVEVVNAPPSPPTSVQISPSQPTTDDDLVTTATGGSDPDGDPVSYDIKWYVNNSLAGTSITLQHSLFDVGDTVRVDVRSSDGLALSEPRSKSVIILPVATPTPTPTPSPTPTPTPTIPITEYSFDSSVEGWTFVGLSVPPYFYGASSSYSGGRISISSANDTTSRVGFWNAPTNISYVADNVYRARFVISSSQLTASQNPQLRMRWFQELSLESASHVVNASAPYSYSLPTDPTTSTYSCYFAPILSGNLGVAFDMLDFSAAQYGEHYVDQVTVERFPDPAAGTAVKTYSSFSDFSNWGFVTNVGFDPVTSGGSGTGTLTISSSLANSANFGWWQSSGAANELTYVADKLYRATYTLRCISDAVRNDMPQIRLRCQNEDSQMTATMELNSQGAGGPGAMPEVLGTDYDVYFETPTLPGSPTALQDGFIVVIDMLDFDAAKGGTIYMDSVTIDYLTIP